MGDARVTVEADGDGETVRVHGNEGEVESGGATFRFSVSGGEADERSAAGGPDSEEFDGTDPRRIAPISDVPTEGTLCCEALDGRRGVEVIVRREGDSASAWRNSCPHEPRVRLDRGDGAIVADGRLVCHKHGARFECGDGLCTAGPCRGDALDSVAVAVRDGDLYLTDDRFEACRRLDG